MSPISSLLSGSAAELYGLFGGVVAPAASPATAATQATSATTAGAVAPVGAVAAAPAPAMLSQVLEALWVQFGVAGTSAPAGTAQTPAESGDQRFSSALAQAVQAGDGTPGSIDAVRTTVMQALGDVSQFLLGAGADPTQVGTAGNALQDRLTALLSASGAGGGGAGVAAQATLVDKGKLTFQVRTAEGDTVTITLRARSTTSATLAAGTAANVTTIDGARLSIDVKGNINAAEAAAIGDVLTQVESLASQFFSGDVTQAFASAASLKIDSSQLASIALQFKFRETFSAVAIAQPPAATPVATPVAADPAAAPTAGAAAPGASPAATPPAVPAAPAAAPAATPADPATAPPSMVSVLQDFLSKVLDFVFAGNSDGTVSFSARFKLELLLAATQTAPVTSGTSATAAPGTAAAGAAATGTSTAGAAASSAATAASAAQSDAAAAGTPSTTPAGTSNAPALALVKFVEVISILRSNLG